MIDIDGGDIILLLLFNFWTLLNLALISLLQRFLWPKTIKNADKNKKKLVFYYPLSITFLLFFFCLIGYFFSSIFSWRSWPKTKEELKKKKNKVTIRNLVLALTVCNVVFSLFFYCIVPLTINFIKSQLRLKQW